MYEAFPYFIAGLVIFVVSLLTFVHFYDKKLDREDYDNSLDKWF